MTCTPNLSCNCSCSEYALSGTMELPGAACGDPAASSCALSASGQASAGSSSSTCYCVLTWSEVSLCGGNTVNFKVVVTDCLVFASAWIGSEASPTVLWTDVLYNHDVTTEFSCSDGGLNATFTMERADDPSSTFTLTITAGCPEPIPNMYKAYCCADDSYIGYTDDDLALGTYASDNDEFCFYINGDVPEEGDGGEYFDHTELDLTTIMGCDDELGPSYCADPCHFPCAPCGELAGTCDDAVSSVVVDVSPLSGELSGCGECTLHACSPSETMVVLSQGDTCAGASPGYSASAVCVDGQEVDIDLEFSGGVYNLTVSCDGNPVWTGCKAGNTPIGIYRDPCTPAGLCLSGVVTHLVVQ